VFLGIAFALYCGGLLRSPLWLAGIIGSVLAWFLRAIIGRFAPRNAKNQAKTEFLWLAVFNKTASAPPFPPLPSVALRAYLMVASLRRSKAPAGRGGTNCCGGGFRFGLATESPFFYKKQTQCQETRGHQFNTLWHRICIIANSVPEGRILIHSPLAHNLHLPQIVCQRGTNFLGLH